MRFFLNIKSLHFFKEISLEAFHRPKVTLDLVFDAKLQLRGEPIACPATNIMAILPVLDLSHKNACHLAT